MAPQVLKKLVYRATAVTLRRRYNDGLAGRIADVTFEFAQSDALPRIVWTNKDHNIVRLELNGSSAGECYTLKCDRRFTRRRTLHVDLRSACHSLQYTT